MRTAPRTRQRAGPRAGHPGRPATAVPGRLAHPATSITFRPLSSAAEDTGVKDARQLDAARGRFADFEHGHHGDSGTSPP